MPGRERLRDALFAAQLVTGFAFPNALLQLAGQLPGKSFRRPNTIPWYGPEYALDDFIVYAFYGHKREHCAQIKLFRKQRGG